MGELENLLEIDGSSPRPQQPLHSGASSSAQSATASVPASASAGRGGAKAVLASGVRAVDAIRRAIWAALFGVVGVVSLFSGEWLVALSGLALAAVFTLRLIGDLQRSGAGPVQSSAPAVPVTALESNDTRPCPYCAEAIKTAAVVCRWCGRDVPMETPAVPGDAGDSRSTRESDALPVSENELDRYMIEAGYSGAQADDGTDYRVLALAELEIMPSDQRKKILGAMRSSAPHPNQDEELHPYAAWVRHGDAQRWAAFMAHLQASARSLPHGPGAADAIASIYPEAVGQPEFDGFRSILETV